jgi:hypothetical protein
MQLGLEPRSGRLSFHHDGAGIVNDAIDSTLNDGFVVERSDST